MTAGLRNLLWAVTAVILVITAWVWFMAWQFRQMLEAGAWAPIDHVMKIFLGYHVLMLIVSFVGWGLQTFWHRHGNAGLFPLALVIGLVLLILAAWQLHLVLNLANAIH